MVRYFFAAKEEQWNIDAYTIMDGRRINPFNNTRRCRTRLMGLDGEPHLSVSFPKANVEWVLAEIRGSHWAISPIIFSTEN